MKKEISPAVIIAAVVALVGVLGFFGYRAMAPAPVQQMDRSEFKKRMGDYQKSTERQGGQGGAPGGPGRGGPPSYARPGGGPPSYAQPGGGPPSGYGRPAGVPGG